LESKAFHYRPGHAKGEDTARRILEAAIDLFADEGFEGVSTRMLAERAGVNLPAIQYYFGSKEGLYRAAIAHIADFVETRMAEHATRVQAALSTGRPSEDELLALLFEMLDGFIDLVTCREAPASAGLLIARAEIENAAALDVLQETVVRRVFRPSMALVARLLGLGENDDETSIRTFAILGQALPFKNKATKMSACPAIGWHAGDEGRLQTIRTLLREQTEAVLRAAKKKTP